MRHPVEVWARPTSIGPCHPYQLCTTTNVRGRLPISLPNCIVKTNGDEVRSSGKPEKSVNSFFRDLCIKNGTHPEIRH